MLNQSGSPAWIVPDHPVTEGCSSRIRGNRELWHYRGMGLFDRFRSVAGRGGAALGVTMLASFFAASVGIVVMIFLSPYLVRIAFKFGPAEVSSIMLLGLLAGATMSRGSPLKVLRLRVAMA